VNINSYVTVINELGNDEDAVVGTWCTAQADKEAYVRMSALLHKTPFSLKVFGDVVFCRRQHFFDSNLNTKVNT